MDKVTIELTIEQIGVLGKVIDSVPGMENARVLLPIYDELRRAAAEYKPTEE